MLAIALRILLVLFAAFVSALATGALALCLGLEGLSLGFPLFCMLWAAGTLAIFWALDAQAKGS